MPDGEAEIDVVQLVLPDVSTMSQPRLVGLADSLADLINDLLKCISVCVATGELTLAAEMLAATDLLDSGSWEPN